MTEVIPGPVPARIGVAVSTYNEAITESLLQGALTSLKRSGIAEVNVVRVPGALELAVAAKALLDAGCDAVVAIGAVIEGETDHYTIVVNEAARGLTEVAIQTGKPVTNAVLAVREYEHALERSQPGPGNKGAEAARAAVETARVLAGLSRR